MLATREDNAGGPQIQGQSGLPSEFDVRVT